MPTATSIVDAIGDIERWFRTLPAFDSPPVYGKGTVVGSFGPTILAEGDATLHTARALVDRGIPWDHLHLELALTKWLWASPHAASLLPPRRIDLAVISPAALMAAHLPDTIGQLVFDAFLEFKYGSGFWQHGVSFGYPKKIIHDVEGDVEKLVRCLEAGICRSAHVVCFEQVDHGFDAEFMARSQAQHSGLRVHLVRAWNPS